MNGIHEVTGSIPVWSTNLRSPASVSELRLASQASVRHGQAEVVRRSGAAAKVDLARA